MKKSASSTVLILLAAFTIIGFILFRLSASTKKAEPQIVQTPRSPATNLVYTKHARCRMDCRDISESEVQEVLANGKLNRQKSDPADKPCPSFVQEGKDASGDDLRVVFAQCDEELRVVTVINLDKDSRCDCPGD